MRRLFITDDRAAVSACLMTRIMGLPQRPSPDASNCFCLSLRRNVRTAPIFSFPGIRDLLRLGIDL